MMQTIYVLVCVCTGYSVMRLWIVLVILTITTPVYAQTVGSTSGAMSTVDISNPANSTNHLITTPTVVAPGLAAAIRRLGNCFSQTLDLLGLPQLE